jgi:ubiquinone/menaquinone biosynthesis C-methylase UbiE
MLVRPLFFMRTFLDFFFKLLYHQFAFTYDLVAAAVSFNRWNDWVRAVLPFAEGTRILELGHGPGHLQRLLLRGGWLAVGIDESAQMGWLAKRNTRGSAQIARSIAQQLPFPDAAFDTVIATFPTEYIFDGQTLEEVRRCLRMDGRCIVLPVAMPKNRFLDWLYKITGESPSEPEDLIKQKLNEPFVKANFETEIQTLDVRSSRLFIIIARRIHAEKIT